MHASRMYRMKKLFLGVFVASLVQSKSSAWAKNQWRYVVWQKYPKQQGNCVYPYWSLLTDSARSKIIIVLYNCLFEIFQGLWLWTTRAVEQLTTTYHNSSTSLVQLLIKSWTSLMQWLDLVTCIPRVKIGKRSLVRGLTQQTTAHGQQTFLHWTVVTANTAAPSLKAFWFYPLAVFCVSPVQYLEIHETSSALTTHVQLQ